MQIRKSVYITHYCYWETCFQNIITFRMANLIFFERSSNSPFRHCFLVTGIKERQGYKELSFLSARSLFSELCLLIAITWTVASVLPENLQRKTTLTRSLLAHLSVTVNIRVFVYSKVCSLDKLSFDIEHRDWFFLEVNITIKCPIKL